MTGQDTLAVLVADQRIGEKIEGNSDLVAGRPWANRQAERQQGIDGAPLRRLYPDPPLAVAVDRQVGDRLVQRAGPAEYAARLRRPVAGAFGCVGACRAFVTGKGKRAARVIEDQAAAIQALRVLEIETPAAMRAGKKLHENLGYRSGLGETRSNTLAEFGSIPRSRATTISTRTARVRAITTSTTQAFTPDPDNKGLIGDRFLGIRQGIAAVLPVYNAVTSMRLAGKSALGTWFGQLRRTAWHFLPRKVNCCGGRCPRLLAAAAQAAAVRQHRRRI